MGDMGAGSGMLIVETIAKVRRAYFAQKKPIKAICREFRVSRKVVRKVIRSEATEFRYERGKQPLPRIGPTRARARRWYSTRTSGPSPFSRGAARAASTTIYGRLPPQDESVGIGG